MPASLNAHGQVGYEILAELGRGTTGVVYLARQTSPNRQVALKVLQPSPGSDEAARLANFYREARVLARLTREGEKNIPALYSVGEYNGRPCYVREHVDGDSLAQRVARRLIDFRAGVQVLQTVAQAVQRVHGYGISHGNLRASNILIAADGTPKVVGFGLAGWLAGGACDRGDGPAVSAGVDVLALQNLLGKLSETLCPSVPANLRALLRAGTVASPGGFASALEICLREDLPAK
jgi:serine/threonine protein kinase